MKNKRNICKTSSGTKIQVFQFEGGCAAVHREIKVYGKHGRSPFGTMWSRRGRDDLRLRLLSGRVWHFQSIWIGSSWREAASPNIGCVQCGMCYEIEMISSS
jgi:hypothetical protein